MTARARVRCPGAVARATHDRSAAPTRPRPGGDATANAAVAGAVDGLGPARAGAAVAASGAAAAEGA